MFWQKSWLSEDYSNMDKQIQDTINLLTNSPAIAGKVAVLCGGFAAERNISLISGNAITTALKKIGVDVIELDVQKNSISDIQHLRPDNAFIAMHGVGGEDGQIQAVLEYLQIPYTGSSVSASALGMDKLRSKLVWQSVGIPTPDFFLVDKHSSWTEIINQLGGEVFVKPSREGSSLGMSIAKTKDQLKESFLKARQYDSEVIAEKRIIGNEYTCAILNGECLPIVQVKSAGEFYDYHAKYKSNTTQYICPCDITEEKQIQLGEMSLRAFKALGCDGWGRVDFLCDEQGNPFFLEVNTVPGMTDHSLLPIAAKTKGLSFEELVTAILAQSIVRGATYESCR